MKKNTNGLMAGINENWKIVVFVGALVVGWTTMQNDINELRTRVATLEERTEVITTIQQDIVEIKTTLQFIRENVEK